MNKYLVLLALAVSLNACKDALDIKPRMIIENEGAITSVKDLESVLTGAYDGMQSGNIFGGNFIALGDFMAEDTKVDETKLSNFGTREIYFRQTSVQIGLLGGMWGDAYMVINRANVVIDVVDNNKITESGFDSKKDRLKGEALFMRAITHFELVRYFAKPYEAGSTTNTQLGVPYRTKPTYDGFDKEAIAKARNTVQEVYDLALADLELSITLLGNAGLTTSISRASVMAAKGYKARMQFMMGKYADAATTAKDVIDNGGFSLNDSLKTVYLQAGNVATPENIFQMVNLINDNSNSIQGYYRRAFNPVFTASDELYDSFDSLDFRKTQLIEQDFANRRFCTKYNQPTAAPINIPLLRLAEMYLIVAESNLSTGGNGNVTEALTYYNTIRERAYKANYVAETNPNGLLAKIQAERRRELFFEGDRLHNLKRLKQNLRDGVAYNDGTVIFKIPQAEVSGNPLMEQNP